MTPDRPWSPRSPSPTAIKKWTRRNRPFVMEPGTPPVVHDATLQPVHRSVGWDARCGTCQRAQAYVQTVRGPHE